MKAFHRSVRGITCILTVLFLSAVQTSAVIINFTEHPQSQEVRFNDSATLECAVSNGVVTQWLFNNGPLPSSGITVNGGTLAIASFQRELAGNYRCVAESTTGSFTQVSHYARISYFAQRQFESQPEDYVVYRLLNGAGEVVREAAVFQCEFNQLRNGIRPVLRWEVRAGGTTTSLQTTTVAGRFVPFQYDHSAYLELHFPTVADNGTEVRCLASDPDSPDQIVESDWASVIISDDPLPPDTAVFSLRPPSEVHFIEGQELVLGCTKTIHNVSLAIQWGISGQTTFYIQAFEDVLFPVNVTVYGYTNIMLEPPDSNHFGITYECSTAVSAGQVAVVSTTVTTPPPPTPLPAYSDQDQLASLMYGTSVTIRVTNYTGAIQWWHNGTAITANTTKYTLMPASSSLLVSNVNFSDAGIYQAELLDVSPRRQFAIFDINVLADECSLMLHDCHLAAVCVDTATSYTCMCTSGFTGDGRTCTDIDECVQDPDSCHADAICMNTAGSYVCRCDDGYQGDGRSCSDVNECEQGTDSCHSDATCTNTDGSYTCQCNVGFQGDGRSCSDVNECEQDTDNCHSDATCMNTDGSYTCQCKVGFQGDGRSCSDVNECEQDTDDCHSNATCTNTDGSYTCQCKVGFQGDGRSCSAVDIDECEQDTDDCHINAICTNTDGSYTCSCNNGFQGDGRSCSAFVLPEITDVEVVNNTHLRIQWTIPTQPVDAYVLEILRYDGNTIRENRTVTVQQNSFIIRDANLNSEYNFRVQATSAAGNSTFTGQFVYNPRKMEGGGLRLWQIAVIVLLLLLAALLCCVLCCCIVFAWKKRRRTYYTEKRERRYSKELQRFRKEDDDDIDTKV